MLTRIYIDNFRCFVHFEYRPERKELLLGPNGSGKSSLLTAIRYLKEFVKGNENPFTQSTRTRGLNRPLQIFEIEALLGKQKYEYRVVIRFARSVGSQDIASSELSISQEQLKVSGATVFELPKGKTGTGTIFPVFSRQGRLTVPPGFRLTFHLARRSTARLKMYGGRTMLLNRFGARWGRSRLPRRSNHGRGAA